MISLFKISNVSAYVVCDNTLLSIKMDISHLEAGITFFLST